MKIDRDETISLRYVRGMSLWLIIIYRRDHIDRGYYIVLRA